MNKEEIIEGVKRKDSHGNVVCKASKAKESAEIEAQTKEFLKKNKITDGGSYNEQ